MSGGAKKIFHCLDHRILVRRRVFGPPPPLTPAPNFEAGRGQGVAEVHGYCQLAGAACAVVYWTAGFRRSSPGTSCRSRGQTGRGRSPTGGQVGVRLQRSGATFESADRHGIRTKKREGRSPPVGSTDAVADGYEQPLVVPQLTHCGSCRLGIMIDPHSGQVGASVRAMKLWLRCRCGCCRRSCDRSPGRSGGWRAGRR